MFSIVLLLTLLLFLILLLMVYGGDFAEPSVLFVLGFALSVFNGLTNYKAWNFDLSLQTCLVVMVGAVVFMAVAYGVKALFRAIVVDDVSSRKYREPQNITLPLWVYVAGLMFTCLSFIIVSRGIIALTLPYGGDGSLSKAIGLYDHLNKFSTEGVSISGIASLLYLATNAMAYVWLFLAMRSFVVRTLKKDYLALANTLAVIPMTLISGGRNSLIQLGVAASLWSLSWPAWPYSSRSFL